jgi:type IV pilus assembly protein PilM
MFFDSNKVIGLDIGTNSIKVIELDVSPRKATVISFGVAPTPTGTISGGEIMDPMTLSQTIKSLLEKTNTKRKHASVGIWGTAVIVKRVSLPKMDLQLLDEQIRWEAEQYIPFDIQEINLEYHVLSSSQSSAETMDILLVAAKKDLIMNYLETVESTGISCSVLDVSTFALANCFMINHPELKNETSAVFDIGSGVTNFVVVENGEAVFARDIPMGGYNYTTDIQKGMGISIQEAEGLKLDISLGRPAPEELKGIVQSSHESFCDELNRSLDFFTSTATSTQGRIERIYITGGGSLMIGLKESLANLSQLPVEIFNPFNVVQVDKNVIASEYISQIAPLAAIAVGLALRKAGDR